MRKNNINKIQLFIIATYHTPSDKNLEYDFGEQSKITALPVKLDRHIGALD
ncbi:hypothetical protein NDQ71_10800 [Pseudoalteromonas sp. KG3]|uniref:Uncharacterized protein n=1 Tax=Pseudoalteromonas prydzensis TaxID=182141 RepID=A0ABR9FHZ6_9GAMM|nr:MULTISPECIES: hypothetical protein [Pseudoalteromonas]MBE0456422.1 hypothetical protein [Pseudoalteromonas prydzensis]WKD22174.1 hypothetical protein NDQ71_10800 [Pseudoalteromonas sp. KG3]